MYLKVKPLKQNLPWNCGPTALRIVLKSQFGLNLTQRDVDLLTGVTEDGASEYNLMRALDMLGFKYEQTNDGNLNHLQDCLRNEQLPIVHIVVKTGEGHYVVVIGIDEENVTVIDPYVGQKLIFGIAYFLGIWKVEENESQTRWYMVATGINTYNKFDMILNHYIRIRKKLNRWSIST